MTLFFFPEDKIPNVVVCSPVDYLQCPRQPFGDVSAEEYFEFAQNALKRGNKEGLVDALSNAKRCFHYQIDRLLYRYNLRELSSRYHFPSKLGLLFELNILPRTLLSVYNNERNAMEHEYTAPQRETVEAAVDLCDLLFLASERFLVETPGRLRVKFINDSRDLILHLKLGHDRIEFYEVRGTKLEEGRFGSYYSQHTFDSKGYTLEGIQVKRVIQDDIEIRKENKEKWIPILQLYSSMARNGKGFSKLPNEPMAILQHYIPYDEYQKLVEFIEMRRDEGKPKSEVKPEASKAS